MLRLGATIGQQVKQEKLCKGSSASRLCCLSLHEPACRPVPEACWFVERTARKQPTNKFPQASSPVPFLGLLPASKRGTAQSSCWLYDRLTIAYRSKDPRVSGARLDLLERAAASLAAATLARFPPGWCAGLRPWVCPRASAGRGVNEIVVFLQKPQLDG